MNTSGIYPGGLVFFLAIMACAPAPSTIEPQDSAQLTDSARPTLDAHSFARPGDEVEGWLREAAALQELGAFPEASASLELIDGARLFLFGDLRDIEGVLVGEPPDGDVEAVVISSALGAPPCVGRTSSLPAFIPGLRGGASGTLWVSDGTLISSDGHAVDLVACNGVDTWEEVRDLQLLDPAEVVDVESGTAAAPPPSCSSACGASESSATFRSQTAYSNGSSTGGSSSCAGGDSYQCTQFVDRVNGHYGGTYNWTGNANTGYWTSSSNGPYQKGLVPFGSGTSYDAPLSGDIVVFSGGSYGHVGVITSVGSSTVTVYDQNRTCGSQSCTEGYSTSSGYTLSNGSGRCFSSSSSYLPYGYARRGWDFSSTHGLASSSSSTNWWPNDASYVSGSSTSTSSYTDLSDYIAVNPGTSDPYLTSPAGLAVPAYSSTETSGYRYVRVYIRSDCTNKTARLYWKRTTDSGFSEDRAVNATVSGSWGTVTFDPSTDSDWSGTIDQIRIDPASSCSSSSSDLVYLQYLYFDR